MSGSGASENCSWMTACGTLTEQDACFPRAWASVPARASSSERIWRFSPPPRQWKTKTGCFLRSACASRFSSSSGLVNETFR